MDKFWKLFGALTTWVQSKTGRDTLAWHVITWLGHGMFAFVGTLVYPQVGFGIAAWYTGREIEQTSNPTSAPVYDRIMDVIAPWVGYVLGGRLRWWLELMLTT